MKIFTIIILIVLAIFLTIYYRGNELLKECPDEMIINKMPSVGTSETPSSYYIKDGARREISEYDSEWLKANCTIPVQEVY